MNKSTTNLSRVEVRDSDKGEILESFILNSDGTPYDLSGKSLVFNENKDGDKFVSDPNVTIVDARIGHITYQLHDQVHSARGTAWFDVIDKSNGAKIDSTTDFYIEVRDGLKCTVYNTTYISDLEKLKQQMETLIQQADGELKTELQKAEQQLNQGVKNFRTQYNSLSEAINQNITDIGLNSLGIKKNSVDIQNLEGAGHLMDILLVDDFGNHITDDYGNRIGGYKWLPLTDVTLTQAGLPADGQAVGEAIKTELQRAEQQLNNQNTTDIGLNSLGIKKNSVDIQNIEGAGHLMDILLVDDAGNYITDEHGNRISGYKWLPLTDTTLTQAGLPADGQAVGAAIKSATAFKPNKYGIPTLYLWGNNILSLKDKSKTLKNEVTYSFPARGISGTVEKFKVQGASSASLPKKNYTLNLDQDVEIFHNYGKQHKYVIKANYLDPSQSMNIVGAKLWGRIRDTHKHADTGILNTNGDLLVDNNGNRVVAETDPQLSIGGNYGAVDGFPIAVYINDQYWGLYSFAIPKDDWMAKMPKSQGKYAIVDAIWDPQGAFKQETNFKDQMELQFCSTEDSQWAMDSVNTLIRAVMATYDTADNFNQAVSPLLDLDSAIDYYIFSVLTNNDDGVFRNYLLQTFDGTKWYFAAYDLDTAFGRTPDFLEHLPASSDTYDWRDHGATFENVTGSNRLFYQLWKFHKDDILSRTRELINGTMSVSAVDTAFIDYARYIPINAYIAELETWSGTPNTSVDNIGRIGRWYMQRIAFLKGKYFNN